MIQEFKVQIPEFGELVFDEAPLTYQDLNNVIMNRYEETQQVLTVWYYTSGQKPVIINAKNYEKIRQNFDQYQIHASLGQKFPCQYKLAKIQQYFSRFRDGIQGKTREIFRKIILLKLLELRKVEINEQCIKSTDMGHLREALPLLIQLKSLTIRGANIEKNAAALIFPQISSITYLQYLRVSELSLSMDAVQSLAEGLQGLLELKELQIFETLMGPEGLITLADSFPWMPKLEILDLRKNYFGPAAAQKLKVLFSKTPALTTLNLSQNNLRTEGSIEVAEGLQLLPNLATFFFRFNDLTPCSGKALKNGLRQCLNLEYLDVSFNKLRRLGCLRVLQAVKYLPKLQNLDIRYNESQEDLSPQINELQFFKQDLTCKVYEQLQICSICNERCGQVYCNYVRRRAFLMLRMNKSPLIT